MCLGEEAFGNVDDAYYDKILIPGHCANSKCLCRKSSLIFADVLVASGFWGHLNSNLSINNGSGSTDIC